MTRLGIPRAQLSWCPCIDDQTRIDFAHATVCDIRQRYAPSTPLTLVSLGSGALKQEELIARLLLETGYSHITLNLIDPYYAKASKGRPLTSLAELEKQVTLFESTPDFEKLGDLYISLGYTDSPEEIKKIESEIEHLEQKIKIDEYVALCDQQAALLHPARLQLLQELLPTVAVHAFTSAQECIDFINPFASLDTALSRHSGRTGSVDKYLNEQLDSHNLRSSRVFTSVNVSRDANGGATILLYVDPDTRPEYAQAQEEVFLQLSAYAWQTYKLAPK